jgi:hypothetical protein
MVEYRFLVRKQTFSFSAGSLLVILKLKPAKKRCKMFVGRHQWPVPG